MLNVTKRSARFAGIEGLCESCATLLADDGTTAREPHAYLLRIFRDEVDRGVYTYRCLICSAVLSHLMDRPVGEWRNDLSA
jgi:hypothetical protein